MRIFREKGQPINSDEAGVTVDSNGMQGRMRSMSISSRSTRTKRSVYYYEFVPQTTEYNKVLEYSLFQPGLFLNYFSYPHKSAEYFHNTEVKIDFQNCRAIVLDESDNQVTLTTVQDLGRVVAAAIDFEGEWPETGGIRGGQIKLSELIKLGEKLRGML